MSKKPEKIYADFVEHYEGYWIKKYKEVILEFLKDLNECVNSKQYTRLKEKWEERLEYYL